MGDAFFHYRDNLYSGCAGCQLHPATFLLEVLNFAAIMGVLPRDQLLQNQLPIDQLPTY